MALSSYRGAKIRYDRLDTVEVFSRGTLSPHCVTPPHETHVLGLRPPFLLFGGP